VSSSDDDLPLVRENIQNLTFAQNMIFYGNFREYMKKAPSQRQNREPLPMYAMDGFFDLLKHHPVIVGGTWIVVFAALTVFSYAVGIMPTIDRGVADAAVVTSTSPQEEELPVTTDDTPVRIIIDRIDVDAPIMNPTSRDIDSLDTALQQGAVHYPGSGDLEDTSNMFLLGHSTGFRVVNNNFYKVFNGLKNLQENDVIRVQSEDMEYLYRVTNVALVNASETSIPLQSSVKMLTLATCNVFGAKEERYVVTAEFVGSYPIDDVDVDL
jgi:LPXTG-site transpeptidase (sortase) family protein